MKKMIIVSMIAMLSSSVYAAREYSHTEIGNATGRKVTDQRDAYESGFSAAQSAASEICKAKGYDYRWNQSSLHSKKCWAEGEKWRCNVSVNMPCHVK